MEDNEEYSYKGYSAETEARIRRAGGNVTVTGDEEEYSFSGFSGVETAAAEEEHTGGDFLIEEFSAETNAYKLSKAIKLSENTLKYILCAVYFVVGLLCLIHSSYIQVAFPYIVGGFMMAIGLGLFIYALKTKEYVHTHSNKTASSLVMMALGALITAEYDSAFTIIAVAWGFLGLSEAAHAFNHAFSRIARSGRCAYYIGKGVAELVLAILLLYEPGDAHHITLHIMVFGIQLIFDALTTFPPIKDYLSRK